MSTAEKIDFVQNALENRIFELPVEMIFPNPNQPRKHFEPMALVDLATSIKQYGLMHPISVRISEHGYELIAGERRLRAAKLAELTTISAVIVDISAADSAVLALVENLQRQNLNYIEEAEGFSHLISQHGLTQDDLARKLGKNQSTIANKIRLLKLPDKVKKVLVENGLSERHARALLKLDKECKGDLVEENMMKIVSIIIRDNLTVQKTEELIEKMIKTNCITEEKKDVNKKNIKYHVKDVRIFTNTIKKAIGIMQESGVNAVYDVEESGDGCIITVMVSY